ncbi:kinase-like domain-containing protein [Rhizophagus clarus]|uniref:Kinase-like domain-containing protein n=1 Tax=Rhizophagus clarus TaxID=94130 RepID=A0A8H3M435_9GLOM|nr:kinase-like domain-containing protein [Rhizophagus clarus]
MSSQNNDRPCEMCGKQYGDELNAEYEWCKPCQMKCSKESSKNWTSGNEKIDDLIQEMRSKINDPSDIVFEWISYNQFNNVIEERKDNFATVYSAIWKDGPLSYSYFKKKLTRVSGKKVALKCLYKSQNITNEFLNEVKTYSVNYLDSNKIYGISQNPDTKDYIMVLHYEYFEKYCKSYCKQCGSNMDTELKWCRACHLNLLRKNLTSCTSGNRKIDGYIQEMQLNISDPCAIVFEWIPYDQFNNISEIGVDDFVAIYSAIWKGGPLHYEYMTGWIREPDKKVVLKCLRSATNEFLNEVKTYSTNFYDDNLIYGISQNPRTKEYIMILQDKYHEKCVECEIQKGDFATVYSAIWKDGPIYYLTDEKEWVRNSNTKVALKLLRNSQNLTNEVLNKIKIYLTIGSSFVLNVYGISQNSDTKDYIVVLQYAEGGNLNDWVQRNHENFNWTNKICALLYIIQGLKEIHNMGLFRNIGNIEVDKVKYKTPAEVHGNIRYSAPEILEREAYSQAAAGIYSFGLIMYFVATGKHPRYGIKSEINEPKAPKCYIDLMKKCLNLEPQNRPNAIEIEQTIKLFYSYLNNESIGIMKIKKQQYNKIEEQFEEAEEYRKVANLLFIEYDQLISVDDLDTISIKPYIPLIQTSTNLIIGIIGICEAADYNKKICNALVERVVVTYTLMELLQRTRKNEERLRNEVYYKNFYKFIYVLEEVKKFAEDISKIYGFRKYLKAIPIKEKFIELTVEYDNAMKDLHFTMVIDSEERKIYDEKALIEDLPEFDRYLNVVDKQVDNISNQIMYIINHLDDLSFFDVNNIDSKDLTFPVREKSDDRRGKDPNFVVRRIYNEQEVACKPTLKTEGELKLNSRLRGYHEILMKLSECEHILKFYGVSKIDNTNVLVFEWAHYGTLKELYEKKDIQWHYKIQIALKICRGLIFLQKVGILHHDLRCENILMTQNLEPKIYNFNLTRYIFENIATLRQEIDDAVRWLAPEKLINFKSKYTTRCEIFSFGILLWELAFETIPYRSLKLDDIRDFVIKGGREIIKFRDSNPEISKFQTGYKKIIINAWKNDPRERISFLKAFNILDELYNSISHMIDENMPALLDDKILDLDDYDGLVLSDENISPIMQVISFGEGIQAHKAGDYQKSWECFEYHAENGNEKAKYWKGYYLLEGLNCKKDFEKGRKLLKEVADEGIPEAQLRYAFTLFKSSERFDKEIFMNYLTKAAEGNNSIAQFNLGDIYCNGKLNIPKNENEGVKWLRKAALQDHTNSIKFLKKLGIGIID